MGSIVGIISKTKMGPWILEANQLEALRSSFPRLRPRETRELKGGLGQSGMDFLCPTCCFLRLASLFEPMYSANMWITHFFLGLGCFACDITLGNTFISAPATVKENKVVLPAARYAALFLARPQASMKMVKSVLIWTCGTPILVYILICIWSLLVHML